ncbi:MAG: prolyl-tRNA synthetase [Patescibacteria group bacterium]|jgi:prolyl-tRNA synthetase
MSEKPDAKGITITKEQDIADWYEQVCLKSNIADFGPSKGTIIIRPKGYFIWEQITKYFNTNINDKRGVENAFFPLFIPESFFKKEAQHAEGFAPEVAWIDKELTGEGERLAIRPTSETIIADSFSKWLRSYKDLPMKVNQWCNVVRWETKATKLFLRGREFIWQEGHCLYQTKDECEEDTLGIIQDYQTLAKDLLAIPTIIGLKTQKEKFAGADQTYTIEGFMPDGKALQSGTSHNLGQNFAKAFDINYIGQDEKQHIPYQNSWGLSYRIMGGLIMTHSDNKGLVLPPKVSRNKLVITPLFFKGKEEEALAKAIELKETLQEFNPILDERTEVKPGAKFSEWEMQGIPLRVEIGPKDIEANQVIVVQRNNNIKHTVPLDELNLRISVILDKMHTELYDKANETLQNNITEVSSWDTFKSTIENKKIAKVSFCNTTACEEDIKEETKATSRCIILNTKPTNKECVKCQKKATVEIYFSKSY